MKLRTWLVAAALIGLTACEDKPQNNTSSEISEPAETAEAAEPAPSGPPEFAIDSIGAKVGFERTLTDQPEGLEKLASELAKQKEHVEGKSLLVTVDRQAKRPWVVSYLNALFEAGARSVKLKTESREGYPTELEFLPQSEAKGAPGCSVVGMILDDRSTAMWKLAGGTASRRQKGMAGPDLSMTGETLERMGRQCKESSRLFVSASENVEWGLIYDLAASSQRLDKFKFDQMVLLDEVPTAGHKIELN